MTREEEIREAAIQARCAVATSLSGDNYSSIDDLPFIEGKLSYDELVENAFVRGAEWAENHSTKKQSLWHDAKEKPVAGSEIVVICPYKGKKKLLHTVAEPYMIPLITEKWAYLDDLINL